MSSFFGKIFKLPVYIHLLALMVITCIIVYIVLKSIDGYTSHNQAVYVPDVRGLQVEDAISHLEQNSLRYIVVDSVFSKDAAPGAIMDLAPEANSKVKRNRIISITINAKSEETALIPEVADMSLRQSSTLLKARGFLNVEYKYVSGEFRDLTIGVEYGSRMIEQGTRVPMTANLILVISDGNATQKDNSETGETKPDTTGVDKEWL